MILMTATDPSQVGVLADTDTTVQIWRELARLCLEIKGCCTQLKVYVECCPQRAGIPVPISDQSDGVYTTIFFRRKSADVHRPFLFALCLSVLLLVPTWQLFLITIFCVVC